MELDDGSTKIFFNTKGNIGDIDEDMSNFLKYIEDSSINGDFVREVANEVERLKAHDATRVEYMSLAPRLADERDEGRDEGEQIGIIKSIRKMMQNLSMTLENAMETLEIPQNEKELYRKKILAGV